MKMLQLTEREYEEHANLVFNRTIDFLHEKEFITDDQAEELAHHAVIVRKLGFFQRVKQLFKHDDVPFLIIVRERSLGMLNQTALTDQHGRAP